MTHTLQAALLVALALCLAPHPAKADPTTALMMQLGSDTDPEGCGQLGAACCLRRGENSRCGAPNLACISDGSAPLCVSCGGEQQAACRGAWLSRRTVPF
jgi:hypothetical protein